MRNPISREARIERAGERLQELLKDPIRHDSDPVLAMLLKKEAAAVFVARNPEIARIRHDSTHTFPVEGYTFTELKFYPLILPAVLKWPYAAIEALKNPEVSRISVAPYAERISDAAEFGISESIKMDTRKGAQRTMKGLGLVGAACIAAIVTAVTKEANVVQEAAEAGFFAIGVAFSGSAIRSWTRAMDLIRFRDRNAH